MLHRHYSGFLTHASALTDVNAGYATANLTAVFPTTASLMVKSLRHRLSTFRICYLFICALRFLLWACRFPMPITSHGVSYLGILLFHNRRHYLCPAAFRPCPVIDPYIRRFVSAFPSCVIAAHSDHRHFVGLRHIAYIACLQATFVILLLRYASADFTELLTI